MRKCQILNHIDHLVSSQKPQLATIHNVLKVLALQVEDIRRFAFTAPLQVKF